MNPSRIETLWGNQIRVRVCGILRKENKILFIKHLDVGEDYLWAPPGGGLLFGETIEHCLKREFQEETHLDIHVQRFLTLYEFIQPPLHAIELFYEVTSENEHPMLGKDPELPENYQILREMAFLSLETIQNEKPSNVHPLATFFFKEMQGKP